MSDKTYVGRRLGEFESGPALEPISKVLLWYDDENAYAAGDDAGRVLELHCPWATREMAENILAAIGGYVYRPYTGSGAMLDPAAELGDAVTVNGTYSLLASVGTSFDALCLSDISAPAEKEVDHEYPFESPQGRELRRKVSLGQSYYGAKITRKDGLVIEKTDGENVTARVVMNADELAFYTVGDRVLYFDPTTGTYKFTGELNVNDKFIVEKSGDVTMKGNINLAGNINMSGGVITWGNNGPVKYQFSSAGVTGPWHDNMSANDKYRRDSLDGGTTWGAGYQFVGVDGEAGAPGTDGDPRGYLKSIKITEIGTTSMKSALIQGARIEGAEIWGGTITSGTTIEVGTDATIGQWLKLKGPSGNMVGIVFNGDSIGEGPGFWSQKNQNTQKEFLTMTAQVLNIIGDGLPDSEIALITPTLDLSAVEDIKWGNNKPRAYFA